MTVLDRNSTPACELSIVIPLFNEAGNMELLLSRLSSELAMFGRSYEILCVNDGSTDGTDQVLRAAAEADPHVKVINFRRNHGQTAAMMAGFDHSRGQIIIPIDGDLQNDPSDIVRLVEKLEEGYSVVSGWRVDRQDNPIARNFPSRVANWLISRISRVHLHDYGCSLKAYRRDVLQDVRLYGEMHRFIPIYASWQGGRVTEIPVKHHARHSGQSKYGLNRVFKVILDLIVVKFLEDYTTKPIYVFGFAGLLFVALSALCAIWALTLKLTEGISLIQTPLPLLMGVFFVTGVTCVLLGLLAELLMRVYYETQGRSTYSIRSTINLDR